MSATNDRQVLSEVAEQAGWQRREVDRTDFYRRGIRDIEVFFTEETLAGGTLFEDLQMLTYSREMDTVQGWLTRPV